MAEQWMKASSAAASRTQDFAPLNNMIKAQAIMLQARPAAPAALPEGNASQANLTVTRQPSITSSQLDVPTNVVDTIEQKPQKSLAPAVVVPTAGPRLDSFTQELPPAFIMPQPMRPIFPVLMRAQENTLSKADVRATLSTNLAPRTGMVPSQPFRHNENTFGRLKSPQVLSPANGVSSNSSTKPMQAIALSISPTPPADIVNLTSTFNIKTTDQQQRALGAVGTSRPMNMTPLPLLTPSSSSRKHERAYVLPDGTVTTSGKGLGRGRPGIKRGPRKSKLATEITAESPKATEDTIVVSSVPNKRGRTSSDELAEPATPSEPSTRASSEEFIPENTQTRSGRQAQKPAIFVPSATSTPTAKRPRLSSAGPSAAKPAALSKIKRKAYRGREHAALCEHCLRGYGPPENVIVFCDACNKCWHQRCHEPHVVEAVIKDSKAEWYCSDCERIINGPKKGGKKAASKPRPSLSLFLSPIIAAPLVGASSLTREQREAQLSALTKEKLVEMLMRATDLAPALPLFENPKPPATPTTAGPIDPYPTPTQEEDDYEYLYDEHAALYPKPGHGVKLPPESTDLAMLLEGPECKTFSHTLLTPAQRGMVGAPA